MSSLSTFRRGPATKAELRVLPSPQVARKNTGSAAPPRPSGVPQGLMLRKPVPTKRTTKSSSTTSTTSGGGRRQHRFRPGELALQQIRKFQQSTNLVLRKLPFRRLAKEISEDFRPGTRWSVDAMEGLQEATEAFLVRILADSNLCAIHAKRVTIMPRDMHLAVRIGGGNGSRPSS